MAHGAQSRRMAESLHEAIIGRAAELEPGTCQGRVAGLSSKGSPGHEPEKNMREATRSACRTRRRAGNGRAHWMPEALVLVLFQLVA